MIIDALMANDELELIKFRIKFLGPVVDKFYIAESGQTFQGREKPLNIRPHLQGLLASGANVEILEIPQSPYEHLFRDAWDRENYQRAWLLETVAHLHPNDLIHFSDVDELASHEQLRWADAHLGAHDIRSVPMQFVFRYANWLLAPVRQNYRPSAVFRGSAAHKFARNAGFRGAVGEKGAHLSYVGFDAEQVKEKFSSFSHIELDVTHLYQPNVLDFADRWGIDHIGRPGQPGFGLLKKANAHHLNSVLQAAIGFKDSWQKDFPERPLLRRLVASSALNNFRASGKTDYLLDPERPMLNFRFLRHLAIILVHTAIRVTRTGTLVKKLQSLTSR